MRYLTTAELKLVMERGPENLPDLTPAEIVEALALEVSERRADMASARDDATEAFKSWREGRELYGDDADDARIAFAAGWRCLALALSGQTIALRALLRDALAALRDLELRSSTIRRSDASASFWNALRTARQLRTRAAEAGIGEGGK